MSYFQTFNDAGVEQFDAGVSTMSLMGVVQATIGPGAGAPGYTTSGGNKYFVTLVAPAAMVAPVIVWDCEGGYVRPVFSIEPSSSGRQDVTFVRMPGDQGTVSLTAYFYDLAHTVITPANYGMQLFDGNGTLIYDAVAQRGQIFKPVQIITSPSQFFNTAVAPPSGRKYAVGFTSQPITTTTADKVGMRGSQGFAGFVGGAIRTASSGTYIGGSSDNLPANTSWGGIVIADVTYI